MALILFKWFFLFYFSGNSFADKQPTVVPTKFHPIYVSVTEIEHNNKDKLLEISCKIFTDDFEKILKQNCNCMVDLLHPKDKKYIDSLINKYIQQHFQIKVNDKVANLEYVGYEQIEDAIYSYWQVKDVNAVNKLDVISSLLYDYKKEQLNIVHVIVQNNRKSSRAAYPNDKMNFVF